MPVPSGAIVKHKDGYYADPIAPTNAAGPATGSGGPAIPASYYAQQLAFAPAGHSSTSSDYAPIIADADATRARNMARIGQYGASQRSDLDIKNKQALAAARQSAISRGLGNTTIQDSLVRGQNFDNNRQTMALEDQLLQNRISTDSSLSKNYQDVMQSRAESLAGQWSTTQGIYAQGLQMANANQQAAYAREAQYAQMANSNQQSALDRQQQLQLAQQQQRPQGQSAVYSGMPVYGSFGPAGTAGMTLNTFGNQGRGTFSRGR